MKKRLLLAVLAFILVACCVLFASCKPRGDETSSSSQQSESRNESEGGGNESEGEGNEGESESSGSQGGNQGGGNQGGGNQGGSTASNSIANVRYLRISKLTSSNVTIKFNAYTSGLSYDIRYSESEITEENFDSATKANATVSGTSEITAVISGIKPSLSKAYYIGVRSYKGDEHGQLLTVRAGGDMLIETDYDHSITNVYHGESLSSFAALFDEQDESFKSGFIRPTSTLGVIYPDDTDSKGNPGENVLEGKVGMLLRPIINLEYSHYVSKVSLFYGENIGDVTVRWAMDEVDFQAENSKWDGCQELSASDLSTMSWNDIEVGESARYVQIIFKDGQAPSEIFVYGYQNGEANRAISTTQRPLPTMAEMMGMCGFVAAGGGNTPVTSVNCTTVLREYHNFGWSYTEHIYPGMASKFSGQMGNFDSQYKSYKTAGILVIPCIQWTTNNAVSVDEDGLPIKEGTKFKEAGYFEKFDPAVYFQYADNMYAFALRYGRAKSTPELIQTSKYYITTTAKVGLDLIDWLEFGNEPNGEDSRGMTPYQLAALQSASYDGHEKSMVCSYNPKDTNKIYHLGSANADPTMKVAMAGLAGTGGRYITSMCYWLQANRTDGSIAMDAFNFHCYFSRTYYMNGVAVQTGVSPEYYNIVDAISGVIDYRNKYYPEKEVWITEFGWDTNPSWETMTAAHAYGEYNSHQVQAMWLTRAYLLFSTCGIDKATMYMCEDVSYDATAVGKYGTCGVIGFDQEGNEYKKDSYYYLYTLKNTLGDYTFQRELDTGSNDVWVYEYKNADGKVAYAVWCPTQDGTKVDNFKLKVDGSSATLVEAVDLDTDGVSTDLTVSNGYVTINVSENPVYVVMK